MMQKPAQTAQYGGDRLPLRLKLSFSTGDLSTSIPLAIVMFFQLYFLTDVAGLNPALAAWAVGIGRLWDAINDPIFGLISDRIRSPWGRRRVILLFGAVPLGVSFAMMWLVPDWGPLALTAYYAIAFVLFDTIFTAIHVSYNSLTPELTPDYDERSSLTGYRMVFSIAGTLGAIIFATVLSWYITNTQTLYAIVGIGLGLASIIPPLIVFAVTHEGTGANQEERLSFGEALKTTLSNRPFWLVMGLYLLSWTTASILAATLIYYANYYLGVPDQANYFVLLAQGSAILFIPLWVWVARRLDKRRAFILGTASWIVVLLGIYALQPHQVSLAYLLAFLAGSGIAVAYVVPWSMVPDIIEYDELDTGERREGSYYAFASFFQKLATGAAIWALGQALAATGYINPIQGQPLPAQPTAALQAIRIFMGPVPAVLLLLSIVFAWAYPISRERHRELRDELAAREM
jgi:GPH family glycoside/pentoside/hexuronide:cation symporter